MTPTPYSLLPSLSLAIYLVAVVLGALAAFRLASSTAFGGRGWAFGLASLAGVWLTTAAVAYYSIRWGQIQFHKEWMARPTQSHLRL